MKGNGALFVFVFLAASLTFASGFLFARAQSADTAPPTIPTGVTATFVRPSQVRVSWTISGDNVGVAGYYVYRNGGLIASAYDITYLDTVSQGLYSYMVAAYDAAGNVSAKSAASSVVTVTYDTTPPSTPTNLSATATAYTITVSWSASTDNVGVGGYYLYRNNIQLVISSSSPYTSTSYIDSGLTPGTTYTYTVVAYDTSGNLSNNSARVSATTISDVSPPSAPYLLSVATKSYNEIDVAWTPATDNVGVAGYYVYRDDGRVASVSSSLTSYADKGLSAATTHYYYVSAYDAANNISQRSNQISATTYPPDVTPPSIPLNFTITAISTSRLQLAWWPSSDDVGVYGYHVYRNGNQIANLTSTSYVDTGLASGTVYTYYVESYDAAGNVSPQSTVTVTTPAINPVVVATTTPAASVNTPTNQLPAAPTTSVVAQSVSGAVFSSPMYLGLRSGEVKTLQSFFIQQGYLSADSATGYFGVLTQGAVQKFQCAQNIVCSGSPRDTGWGFVGAKTRTALNALYSGAVSPSPAQTNAPSAQQLQSTLQSLLLQLQSLQTQLNSIRGGQ